MKSFAIVLRANLDKLKDVLDSIEWWLNFQKRQKLLSPFPF